MKIQEALYMFAIMPPQALSAEIHQQRLHFAQQYGFKKALKPPVHITLIPPFKIPIELSAGFEQRVALLREWSLIRQPFDIQLDGFSWFPNLDHPVLFIKVLDNLQLQSLYTNFVTQLHLLAGINVSSRQFTPHITIGYRDIPPQVMPAICADYATRTFNASFTCNSIFFWKHDSINWQIAEELPFAG